MESGHVDPPFDVGNHFLGVAYCGVACSITWLLRSVEVFSFTGVEDDAVAIGNVEDDAFCQPNHAISISSFVRCGVRISKPRRDSSFMAQHTRVLALRRRSPQFCSIYNIYFW
jgi:hypothetical protein